MQFIADRHAVLRSIAAVIVLLLMAAGTFAEYLKRHPANPHIFLFHGKPTVIVTSGEHYGAVMNLDFDYRVYLEHLQKIGLNGVRIWSGFHVEGWDQSQFPDNAPNQEFPGLKNTSNPDSAKLIAPWARSTTPGYKKGGNKFDLDTWDTTYFNRLKDFMNEADKREIIVEMCLFSGIYMNSNWQLSPVHPSNNISIPATGVNVFDLDWETIVESPYHLSKPDFIKYETAMVRKFAEELKDCGNLYYEICNEYFFNGTDEWHDSMAAVLRDAEKSFPEKHLISKNIPNNTEWFVKATGHPELYDIMNFHYLHTHLKDFAPQLFKIPNFIFGANENEGDSTMRYEGWQMALCGGAIFNNLDWFATAQDETGGARVDSCTDRRTLRSARDFLGRFDISKFQPVHENVPGTPAGHWSWTSIDPAGAYISYIHPMRAEGVGGAVSYPLHIDFEKQFQATLQYPSIPAGSYIVEWYDPRDLKVLKSEEKEHSGGAMELPSPSYLGDITLLIRKKDYPIDAPVVAAVCAAPKSVTTAVKRKCVVVFDGMIPIPHRGERMFDLCGRAVLQRSAHAPAVGIIGLEIPVERGSR